MWYFYVVRCCDNSLYAGITTDVDRRVSQHNTSKRGAKYTRSRRPVALVHVEEFTSKSMPEGDKVFFDTLERCAADNARAITNITSEIDRMRRKASRKMRQLNGYRTSRSQ